MIFLISMIIMITMLFGGALGLISNEVNGNAKIWLFSLGLTLIALAAIRAIIHLNYSQILEKLSIEHLGRYVWLHNLPARQIHQRRPQYNQVW